jgi:aryl-alcohol dehydrogenase-like predicted oxidoreductase
MRYRSYGVDGRAISSIAVQLDDPRGSGSRELWRDRVRRSLSHGVNAFEVVTASQGLAEGLGDELAVRDRAQVIVSWRIRSAGRSSISGLDIADAIEQALDWTGLTFIDMFMLEWDVYNTLEPGAWEVLDGLARAGAFERLGIVGGEQAVDLCLADGRFTAVKTFYDIVENPVLRRKIADAARMNVIVMARAYFGKPTEETVLGRTFLSELGDFLTLTPKVEKKKTPVLDFLKTTLGWTPEEMALGCLLADPSVTTGVVETLDDKHIGSLAISTDRDLPGAATAQLEIARTAGARLDPRRSERR